jgi:sodium-dependent dicarboxylate transporter 2/3/5
MQRYTASMVSGLESGRRAAQWIGLFAGPLLALLCFLLLPESFAVEAGATIPFTTAGRATLAVMVWMATWWLTEAIDISATALLPIAVFPILGIANIKDATAPYASDIIFLFMGGFLLALSMQRWGLDKRIALMTLRIVGTRPPAVIAGFMIVTATLSMWVSNTATAAMMLPIAISVIDVVLRQSGGGSLAERGLPQEGATGRNFALSLMLGIAYAASIGGIGTIIGSPPNGILVKFVKETYGRDISFMDWLAFGLPLVALFLPIAWVLITWVLYPIGIKRIEGGRALFTRELRALGPMKAGEWATFIVFLVTALAWITRPWLANFVPGINDATIAIAAGLMLFLIPVGTRDGGGRSVMDWPTAVRLPWGILILFGGGLSLAAAVSANGVADFLGTQVAAFQGWPTIMLVLIVTTFIIFLTELTSNTATTATLVPILAALAPGLGVNPYLLIVPATLAASCAFMMPVATPPNAIVFGSGYVTIPQMCKAGFWLNLAGIAIVTLLAYLIVLPVFADSAAP